MDEAELETNLIDIFMRIEAMVLKQDIAEFERGESE